MNSADYVDNLIVSLKDRGIPLSDAAWEVACACVGWPYLFGARGGKTVKNGITVRQFDCRGFTYWILLQIYGWKLMGAGCTSQWNNEDNWKAKGKISDGIPKDTLVCLFYSKDNKEKTWEHTGFGYKGETCECSAGVQHFTSMKKKWTHWAIPACVDGDVPQPDPDYRPTLRRGDKGAYVTLMQTELIAKGYSCGSKGPDGIFGKDTESAVRQFQSDNGLTVDSICGKATWTALDAAPASLYTVHIPHLTKYKAEALIQQYGGAWMTPEEGSGNQ